ncbi:MAG: 6-carboxytetrahydropterin synthase [Abditibacteriota bacterium]|nr:6-carboxytetrahydropterin synthase [Abditibacteriota bacterium]
MYYLEKELEISASHKLQLDYESKCSELHGHNWKIVVYCKSEKLDRNGVVIDFTTIKQIVNELDHANLNDILEYNPTAENIARWLVERIPYCYKVSVQETEGNKIILDAY